MTPPTSCSHSNLYFLYQSIVSLHCSVLLVCLALNKFDVLHGSRDVCVFCSPLCPLPKQFPAHGRTPTHPSSLFFDKRALFPLKLHTVYLALTPSVMQKSRAHQFLQLFSQRFKGKTRPWSWPSCKWILGCWQPSWLPHGRCWGSTQVTFIGDLSTTLPRPTALDWLPMG